MRKVIKIDKDGLYIEDVILRDDELIPTNCIETPCPDGFYSPKWLGAEWAEGLTEDQIAALKASEPVNIKAQAVAEMEMATTVAGLKAAMLKFVNA